LPAIAWQIECIQRQTGLTERFDSGLLRVVQLAEPESAASCGRSANHNVGEEKLHAVETDAQCAGRPMIDIASVQVVGAQLRLSQLRGCAAMEIQQQAHGAQLSVLRFVIQAIELQGLPCLIEAFGGHRLRAIHAAKCGVEAHTALAPEKELSHAPEP
jgi:hypothetical protein